MEGLMPMLMNKYEQLDNDGSVEIIGELQVRPVV